MTDRFGRRAEFTRRAEKDVARLDARIRVRVFAAIEGLLREPPEGTSSDLSGSSRPNTGSVWGIGGFATRVIR